MDLQATLTNEKLVQRLLKMLLTACRGKDKGGGGKEGEKDKKTTYAEQCYDRVKSWTKKIDIFSKRMLIFPICDDEHWYVMIVVNPGQVLSQKMNKDFEDVRKGIQIFMKLKRFYNRLLQCVY